MRLVIQNIIYQLAAETFAIPVSEVAPELNYQSISQWDSMAHINLILALENKFNISITQDEVLELVSIEKIINYVLSYQNSSKTFSTKKINKNEQNKVSRGLSGIYLDETAIVCIDGKNGELYYRGYTITDLVQNSTYEEVVHLLLF